jgi:hypothetical protein
MVLPHPAGIINQLTAGLNHSLREHKLTNSMQPEEAIRTGFPFLELGASDEPGTCRWLSLFAGSIVV